MVMREKFVEWMTTWADLIRKERELTDFLHKRGVFVELDGQWDRDDLLMAVLQDAMHDEYDWIPYFVWERDCNLDGECVKDADGNPIDTSSWSKVYDLIVSDADDNTDDACDGCGCDDQAGRDKIVTHGDQFRADHALDWTDHIIAVWGARSSRCPTIGSHYCALDCYECWLNWLKKEVEP